MDYVSTIMINAAKINGKDRGNTLLGCDGSSKPINVAEFESFARNVLPKNAFDYYFSGSNDMITFQENRSAYARLRILPRCLVDVSEVSTETSILGEKVSSPICIAPSAMQQMAHPEGERAVARAAAKSKTLMTLSSLSTVSLEGVAEAGGPQGLRWFQLYVYKHREVAVELIRRAENAGYKALVLTVDTPILGRRESDIRNKFSLPSHLTLGNFANISEEYVLKSGSAESGIASYVSQLIDQSLTWSDITWLRSVTTLKIVLKGIMHPDDVVTCIEHGVDAIWVSNHGARQLDTTPATIEVLPEIVKVVAGQCEVYVDGGVMRGTDVFKALALGARAVFVGRPILWGLAHSGEDGVASVLKLLNDELVLAMKLAGCVQLSDIHPNFIRSALSFRAKL